MENQILDEARKKAAKILQNADKECQKLEQELKQQFVQNVRQLEEQYQQTYTKIARDLAATLPLDLKRKKLAFIENTIKENLADFFANLQPGEATALYKNWLSKVKDLFAGQTVHVRYHGLQEEEVKSLLNSQIPEIKIARLEQEAQAVFTGLILTSADEKLKYRCTLTEVKKMLAEDYREAMYTSLFKEQL
jgi:vacuolar-type H+-ATPase subunit E/Vma4